MVPVRRPPRLEGDPAVVDEALTHLAEREAGGERGRHVVAQEMDVVLLAALERVPWASVERAADLGCGTGRTGAWLRQHGVARIDGIDLTPEMLAIARGRGIYERLAQADVAGTGLEGGTYDLVTTCLVDEHLRDLRPLYREGARLLRPGGIHCSSAITRTSS